MKVSTILNMKETQFCVLKLCFTLEIIYVYRLYKAKQNEIIFVGVKLIFTYFLCCWAFFSQFNETFFSLLLLLNLRKTE